MINQSELIRLPEKLTIGCLYFMWSLTMLMLVYSLVKGRLLWVGLMKVMCGVMSSLNNFLVYNLFTVKHH